MEDNIQNICTECQEKTKILYKYRDGFFTPKLKGINHLEVGYSWVISNPVTIFIEYLYVVWKRIRRLIRRLSNWLFPRRPHIHAGRLDSYITGRIIHADHKETTSPIHHIKLEFWGRTKWYLGFQWRKLGETESNNYGIFHLDYTLRQARNFKTGSLRLEIHQPFEVHYNGDKPSTSHRLYHSIPLIKTNLIGMGYYVHTLALPLWEYRKDTPLPRTFHSKDSHLISEVFSQGRIDAFKQQVIPIELTKRKHMFQIEKEPGMLSIADIQADYPENLTICLEKKLPGYSRSDEWFGIRMMNGMNMGSFQPDKHDASLYHIRYFGICNYDHNTKFALPDADIVFRIDSAGPPKPVSITFTGQLNAYNNDPWQKHTYTPSSGDEWLQAKRLARVCGSVVAEVDDHFAGTHVNTEQYAIAAFRNFRKNPVTWLLYPHLKEVSVINVSADNILIHGFLPSNTALTEKGVKDRVYDAMGTQNWKGWKPMKVINDSHTYAIAENLFWDITGKFVDFFFEKYEAGIKEHWNEVYSFSNDLVNHSVAVFQSQVITDMLSTEERERSRERFEYACFRYAYDPINSVKIVDGERKVVSPITLTENFQHEEDFRNLKSACRYAIMMATFSHTWINEHQYDDLGEILYNCGGLRFGDKQRGVMAPESDLSIAPDLTRSTQMLWFTNLLSRTEYGFITKNEEQDIHPYFIQLLNENKETFAKLGVDIESIESRTNI